MKNEKEFRSIKPRSIVRYQTLGSAIESLDIPRKWCPIALILIIIARNYIYDQQIADELFECV